MSFNLFLIQTFSLAKNTFSNGLTYEKKNSFMSVEHEIKSNSTIKVQYTNHFRQSNEHSDLRIHSSRYSVTIYSNSDLSFKSVDSWPKKSTNRLYQIEGDNTL